MITRSLLRKSLFTGKRNTRSPLRELLSRDGYQGGMYGEYGGYDIILIKLSQPVSVDLAACLPGRNYRHTTGRTIGMEFADDILRRHLDWWVWSVQTGAL